MFMPISVLRNRWMVIQLLVEAVSLQRGIAAGFLPMDRGEHTTKRLSSPPQKPAVLKRLNGGAPDADHITNCFDKRDFVANMEAGYKKWIDIRAQQRGLGRDSNQIPGLFQ